MRKTDLSIGRRQPGWLGAAALSAVLAATLAAAPAQAQSDEIGKLQEFASASAELSDILTDKEVVTNARAVAQLDRVTKVMGTMGASMALAGAAFEIIMMFADDQESEHAQIINKLDKLDSKLDGISSQIENAFAELDERDNFREARRDLYRASSDIQNNYSHWITHQRQMSRWRQDPNRSIDTKPTFATKNRDMDITNFAKDIGRLCEGNFLSGPLFPMVENRTNGNIGDVMKWGAWIFTRLSEAQQVATFILTEERYAAALRRRGEISEAEQKELMRQMALSAASEVHDSYAEPWDQCHRSMSASLKRLSTPKVIKAYAKKIIEEKMKNSNGSYNYSFFQNVTRNPYKNTARNIGEMLEANFPTTSWTVALIAGRRFDEKLERYAKVTYHSRPGGRTVKWREMPVPISSSNSDTVSYTSLYLHFFFEDEAIPANERYIRIIDPKNQTPSAALNPLKYIAKIQEIMKNVNSYRGHKFNVTGELYRFEFYTSNRPGDVDFLSQATGKDGSWNLHAP